MVSGSVTWMVVVAASLAGLAAWVATGSSSTLRLAAVLRPAGGTARPGRVDMVAGVVRRRLLRSRDEERGREHVTEVCTAVAAELRAGRAPADALALAVRSLPDEARPPFLAAVAAARRGGDVERALREAATTPGRHGLRWLAACWQVGVESGAGLADAVERLGGTLRAERAGQREVAAQLAGPRATARLLAVLPALGLVMATGLGQNPFGFLLGTPYGLACLAIGIALDAAGLFWTGRLARSAVLR